jgi:hypothetical protein
MSLAGHIAGMGRRGLDKRLWWEIQKERDRYEDVDGRIILKWILDK